MIERAHIIELARSWIDTPYRHLGREKGRAIDCIGLIVGVGQELGFDVSGVPSVYSRNPRGKHLLDRASEHLVVTDKKFEQLQSGDIGVFWGYTRHEPQHFAIIGEYGPRLTMIHAFSKYRKVVEHSLDAADAFWVPRLEKVMEYEGTANG